MTRYLQTIEQNDQIKLNATIARKRDTYLEIAVKRNVMMLKKRKVI